MYVYNVQYRAIHFAIEINSTYNSKFVGVIFFNSTFSILYGSNPILNHLKGAYVRDET